jgi:tetratricopeptide (TPR) repeat protein
MRINGLMFACLAAAMLVGCGQRALPAVRESGDRAYRHGDYAAAATDYQEYTDRKPGEAAVELAYAKTLLKLNQPGAAVEHAARAYDQHPTDEDYIETKAQALFEAKKTEELDRFLRGLCQGRGQPADYIRLGRFSQKMGDADTAHTAFRTAARVDGGRSMAPQLALADFYHSIKDAENEMQRLRVCYYLDPKDSQISERIRALGEIPGPSIAMPPPEASESPSNP